MAAYDTAFRMQTEAPKVFDLNTESKDTPTCTAWAIRRRRLCRRCLMARRMVENGVRFVCVVSGGGGPEAEWDAHSILKSTTAYGELTDKPVAALIRI